MEGKYYYVLLGTATDGCRLNVEVITETEGEWQKSSTEQRLILSAGLLEAVRSLCTEVSE